LPPKTGKGLTDLKEKVRKKNLRGETFKKGGGHRGNLYEKGKSFGWRRRGF